MVRPKRGRSPDGEDAAPITGGQAANILRDCGVHGRGGCEPTQNKEKTSMHLKHLALGLAVVMAAPTAVTTAQAENGISFHYSPIGPVPFLGRGYPSPTDCTII